MQEAPTLKPRDVRNKACVACRSKKVRCIYDGNSDAPCQRCARMGVECEHPQSHQRRRTYRLRNRVEQLEDNLNGLVSLLSERVAIKSATALSGRHENGTEESPAESSARRSSDSPRDYCRAQEVIDTKFIAPDKAMHLCKIYETMSEKYFPYVVLPKNYEVSQLREERPMLFRAILASASWQDSSIHISLEEEYLMNLVVGFVVRGECNLDMLQAILVYLAWYHFHLRSPSHQVHRLASIAVSMLVELGLNMRPRDFMALKSRSLFDNNTSQPISSTLTDFWSPEARRAFVGCYILCSSTALLYRRLNPLPFTDYMAECALSLATEGEYPSDADLVYFVHLFRIADEISSNFSYGDSVEAKKSRKDERIQLYLRAFEEKMNRLKSSLSSETATNLTFQIYYELIEIFALDMAIFVDDQDMEPSIFRIKICYDVLEKAKSYLSHVRESTLEDMRGWTFIHWRQLTCATHLAIKVILMMDPASQNDEALSRMSKLDLYFGWLLNRIEKLVQSSPTNSTKNPFRLLLAYWENMRSNFLSSFSSLSRIGFSPNQVSQADNMGGTQGLGYSQVPAITQTLPFTPLAPLAPFAPEFDYNLFPAAGAGQFDAWVQDGFWFQPNYMQ